MNTAAARTARPEAMADARQAPGRRGTRVAVALLATVLGAGLAAPARAQGLLYDRATLEEIAADVLRRGLRDAAETRPESTEARPGAPVDPPRDLGAPDPLPPVAHKSPAREGIHVPIKRKSAPARKAAPEGAAALGYESNSWRQARPETARALSFSSGFLPPTVGLDPALTAQAEVRLRQGREFVYGFILLRDRLDEIVERRLGRAGVELLGPHDDHHKARFPIGSLHAIAALKEVEWLGVSPPEQKLSLEVAGLRGPEARAAGVDRATPIPIVINLFAGDERGDFRRELEATGVALGAYDAALLSYRAVATLPVIEAVSGLDFVLFIELIGRTSGGHDQSTPLVDADIIRPGSPFGHTRFSGATTTLGIMDTGFMVGTAAPVMHSDLNKFGCGLNFTHDAAGAFHDEFGHGTHVLATIAGTGTASSRYRGVAPGVGSIDRIRAAKVWDRNNWGDDPWMESAMNFMSQPSACGSPPPDVINISGGGWGYAEVGTDTLSRKLDEKVWTYGQAYVVCGGNSGGDRTIWRPGVAKNALTVGNVLDNTYGYVGTLHASSSRGPTGDGRMKPNVVAPGTRVTSAEAGTTNGYRDDFGCSMAAPHVTGLAATLMEHDYQFKGRPALLRAHLMATAIAHNDVTAKSNEYGLGRVSGYLAHWDHPNSAGWSTARFWGGVNSNGFAYNDIVVPPGTQRLVVVMTWDEPAASAGASRAVTWDLDLWLDRDVNCSNPTGECGEYYSGSGIDNVEYVVVNNPPAGTYRLKVVPFNAPTFQLRYGMVATIIRGDPTPAMRATLTAPSSPLVGSIFDLTVNVSTPSYVASGVHVELAGMPQGVTLIALETMRLDGTTMGFAVAPDTLTLGNVTPMLGRSATWRFRADTLGPKAFFVRAWSENGGEVIATKSLQVDIPRPDLVETALASNPPAPVRAPGTTFSVTDTVQNAGPVASGTSRTRYYISRDSVRGAGAILLGGNHTAPGLAPGASHSATATVTIPDTASPDAYFLLACADDQFAVQENNELNNCIASATATVTVTRPDLAATAVSAPPATAPRGGRFSVTDTSQNLGAVPSGVSKTRYYLSLDPAKSADDKLLPGARTVPALAGAASHSGSATVTIPSGTPLGTYYLLACADDTATVSELNETNNCRASASTVAITP